MESGVYACYDAGNTSWRPSETVQLPFCVEDGELVLPSRKEIDALLRERPNAIPDATNRLLLYVKNVNTFRRVGSRTMEAGFKSAGFEECNELCTFDVSAACEWLIFKRCNGLRSVRAHTTGRLYLGANPYLETVDALSSTGMVNVYQCDALTFLRGVERLCGLSILGSHKCKGAPLYIAGDTFEGLISMPWIFDRIVTATPLVSKNLWSSLDIFNKKKTSIGDWYIIARRRMDERTWIVLAWRELTGGNATTGLAHSDLLRYALRHI